LLGKGRRSQRGATSPILPLCVFRRKREEGEKERGGRDGRDRRERRERPERERDVVCLEEEVVVGSWQQPVWAPAFFGEIAGAHFIKKLFCSERDREKREGERGINNRLLSLFSPCFSEGLRWDTKVRGAATKTTGAMSSRRKEVECTTS